MALVVITKDPTGLLNAIKRQVKDRTVDSWTVDSDGDFTDSRVSWASKAWFRPRIESDRIIFSILTPKGKKLSSEIYAVFHARFIEMLLLSFDTKFTEAYATALPGHDDIL